MHAGFDVGLKPGRAAVQVLLPHIIKPTIAGILLMTIAAWFSSLEYTILGSQQSILAMMQNLVGVQKYPEVIAFAIIPAVVTAGCLAVVVNLWQPCPSPSVSAQ
jgi:ABC-type spermidine/putrescine transport system permease subunit I